MTGRPVPAMRGATGDAARLLLVTPSYFPDVYGGVERQAQILAEALGRLSWRVTLLAPTLVGPRLAVTQTAFGDVVRLRLKALPARGGRYLGATLSWTARTVAWMVRHRASFDAVYVMHHRLHAAGPLLGAALLRRPVFVKPGGGGEASEFHALRSKKYLYGHLVAALVRGVTTRFIANSKAIYADLQSEGIAAGQISRLPNGVEAPARQSLIQALEKRDGGGFIYAARLVPDKRVEDLIDAASLLRSRHPWRLTIVGDGPERARLQARSIELGLSDHILFCGARADVRELMLMHDFYVSPSPREGQSNALLEALAAGLVPICVDASGVRDLIGTGLGWIVPSSDPPRLAGAMAEALRLAADERREAALATHDEICEHNGIDQVARETARLLRHAIEERLVRR